MEGSVLGYEKGSQSGVIKGDDGKRYNFMANEWKAEREAHAGERVDFEARGDNAVSIYPLKGANPLAGALGALDAIPMEAIKQRASEAMQRVNAASGGNVKALFLSKIENLLAGVIIVAFFMPWVSYFQMSVSGFGFHSVISQLTEMANLANQLGGLDGGYGRRSAPKAPSMGGVYLLYLAYLIPVFAILTIWYNLQNKPRPFAFITGVLTIVLFVFALIKVGGDLFNVLGIGVYITLLCAGGMLAAKYGFLKSPFKKQ